MVWVSMAQDVLLLCKPSEVIFWWTFTGCIPLKLVLRAQTVIDVAGMM